MESGKRKDVCSDEVRRFITNGTKHTTDTDSDHTALRQALKVERVRWHPDKIQHWFGFMAIDNDTLQSVTAVFQIFDDMWNEIRI